MKIFKNANLLLGLFIILLVLGCSNDYKKSAALIEQGQYDNAEKILQKLLFENPQDQKADSLFKVVGAIKMLQSADKYIEEGKLNEAVIRIKSAESNDPTNSDLDAIKDKLIGAVLDKAKKKVDKAQFADVLELIDLVMPMNKRKAELAKFKAEIVDSKNEGKITWEVCKAWREALDLNPTDQTGKQKIDEIEKKAAPFYTAFEAYYQTILNPNYGKWLGYLDAACVKETKEDVARAIEKGYDQYNNLKDYFILDLCIEPAEQGDPNGPTIVGIDIISSSTAWIHYTYPKMLIMEKIKVYRSGGRWKVSCKQESSMTKKV
jgi:tetratricopeptide (TPR) repeat protein